MEDGTVVVFAATAGDLGERIGRTLIARGTIVRELVRPDIKADGFARIKDVVSEVAAADPNDVADMASAFQGAACVVSALNGVRVVMIDREGVLLDAAVKADVPRFMPSAF